MGEEPESKVNMPFESNNPEGSDSSQEPSSEQTEKKTRKRRKRKAMGKDTFVVASDEGVTICEEGDLIDALRGKTKPQAWKLGQKVQSVKVLPTSQVLLGDPGKEEESEKLEIKYDK